MNSRVLFVIALKNLRRHLRRTVINVLSIGISVGILVFFLGYYRGTYITMMRESFIRFKTAHIQIQRPGFNEKKPQDFVTGETVFSDYGPLIGRVAALPRVTAVSGRLIGTGFVGNGREKMVVTVIGADPGRDKGITVVDEFIVKGSYFKNNGGILIGKKTADLFGLSLGDLCYLQAQTVNNTPNVLLLPVTGIYNTGFYELDKNTVFLSLKDADALFDAGSAINKIFIMLTNMDQSERAAREIQAICGDRFTVRPWQFYSGAVLENERSDRIFYGIFLTILIFISVSTITGTMYVNVYERTREIGTLRAIGWTKQEVFRLFVLESLAVGVLGSLAGMVIGGIPTWYLATFGFDYSKMSDVVAIPIFKIISQPKWYDFAAGLLLGCGATYLGGLLPAKKASTMVITEALRVT